MTIMMIMMMKMIITIFTFLAIIPPKIIFGPKPKKRVIFMQKHNFFVKQIFFYDEVEILTFLMVMMILVMMMKMKIDVTQSIFKLGPPDFA